MLLEAAKVNQISEVAINQDASTFVYLPLLQVDPLQSNTVSSLAKPRHRIAYHLSDDVRLHGTQIGL